MEIRRGQVMRSLAGHDKGYFQTVLRLEGAFAYVADGKRRPLEAPKKKKLMHVQIDYQQTEISSDLEIRKALKAKEV